MQEIEPVPEEVTLVMIKPDGVMRGLTDEIIDTFRKSGLCLQYKEEIIFTVEKAGMFYSNKVGEPELHQNLISYLTSGRCVVLLLSGINANTRARQIIGETSSNTGGNGLRGKYAMSALKDTVHGSRDMNEFYHSMDVLF